MTCLSIDGNNDGELANVAWADCRKVARVAGCTVCLSCRRSELQLSPRSDLLGSTEAVIGRTSEFVNPALYHLRNSSRGEHIYLIQGFIKH